MTTPTTETNMDRVLTRYAGRIPPRGVLRRAWAADREAHARASAALDADLTREGASREERARRHRALAATRPRPLAGYWGRS